ncbi:MAG: sugar phosphate isomerase/epimerase [Tannerellaceae bacterium]|jgi:sugar phosphate isomerase/epimerase|nr:sugar phosphate isomerase/epimerase [Tannerellaceae bacterium]
MEKALYKRRTFLKQAGLLALGTMIAPQGITSCSLRSKGKKFIGIQLYSLREMVEKDGIEHVLEIVANTGFRHIETASYEDGMIYGLQPADFRKKVIALNMKHTSAHVGRMLEPGKEAEILQWWERVFDAHGEAGVEQVIFPWMPVNEETTLDDLLRYCAYFNEIGLRANNRGIRFGYHNHAFEMASIAEERILDFLMDHVDSRYVAFELDVYWCQEGGGNPLKFLMERPDQITSVHIKDVKEIGASGKMDFKPIFEQMNANGISNWYVEIEEFTNNDAIKGIKDSYSFLAKAPYVY